MKDLLRHEICRDGEKVTVWHRAGRIDGAMSDMDELGFVINTDTAGYFIPWSAGPVIMQTKRAVK